MAVNAVYDVNPYNGYKSAVFEFHECEELSVPVSNTATYFMLK